MYQITKEEVVNAWEMVRKAAGGPGVDERTIKSIEDNLDNELYKIWNRLSSGSYQAQDIKLIEIPKAKGGVRVLGIPTVTDRIAQSVIKNRLVKEIDHLFHEDSYAYRDNKSAIDAVLKTRERCMKREWVIDIDIKGFFDELSHELLEEMLSKYTQDKLILLYSKKFLRATGVTEEGAKIKRDKGTPQGGVISPILANLYLHEAFDKWMQEQHPDIWFERFADDIIVHCVSEKQAHYLKSKIEERLKTFKLELHPEKTRIVYAGKDNKHDDRGHGLSRKFTFLGYDFKPRWYKGRIVFTPGMGQGALLRINQLIKKLRLSSLVTLPIEDIAKIINKSARGWINYYGHCRRSELYKLADFMDTRLVKWLSKKLKIRTYGRGWKVLKKCKRENPKLFVHWYLIAEKPLRAV